MYLLIKDYFRGGENNLFFNLAAKTLKITSFIRCSITGVNYILAFILCLTNVFVSHKTIRHQTTQRALPKSQGILNLRREVGLVLKLDIFGVSIENKTKQNLVNRFFYLLGSRLSSDLFV